MPPCSRPRARRNCRWQESLRNFPGPLVLVGAGKMGGAMLEGWLRLGLDPKNVAVLEPEAPPQIAALARRGLRSIRSREALTDVAAIVIAVKPQVAPQAIAPLAPLFRRRDGRRVDHGRAARCNFSPGAAETRMRDRARHAEYAGRDRPRHHRRRAASTPTTAQRALADRLLSAAGTVEWVDDEALMDAVTAVSGSGPAYVFLLAEALAQAGVAAGLPRRLAAKLARETVAGSGELLHRSTLDAAVLRENVTSPGGTTAAALAVLMGKEAWRR